MNSGFNLPLIFEKAISEVRKNFKGTEEEFERLIKEKFPQLAEGLDQVFRETLMNQYRTKMLPELRAKENQFYQKLDETYKSSFDSFEIFIDFNKYLGRQYLATLDRNLLADESIKYHVLFRLHARACQVCTEISTLLHKGYADGAHARWRTLHEISVIFLFLFQNDTTVSKMFVEYDPIEKLNRAKKFQEHNDQLGWRPIDPQNLTQLKQKREELINLYGDDFVKSYGWTMRILTNTGDRTFAGIEKSIGLDHLRPFYSWASANVHSGIDGISNRMSIHETSSITYGILSGPSQYGLADPAQFTTYSMLKISEALVTLNETEENSSILKLLIDLHDDVKSNFFEVHDLIKNRINNDPLP